MNNATRAIVTALKGLNEKRYVVTLPETAPDGVEYGESITFSLGTAWKDKYDPAVGQVVMLEDLREYNRGWRAMSVRPVS